jgi:methylmalonyl-CoA/ethylmalonyl-CoA epimerase
MVDHIGFLTSDFAGPRRVIGELLGGEVLGTDTEQRIGLEILWMELCGTKLEFLRPLPGNDRTARSIADGGPRIHHLAIAVADVARVLADLRQAGVATRDQAPRPGSRGTQIAFVDPQAVGGALIELVQHP